MVRRATGLLLLLSAITTVHHRGLARAQQDSEDVTEVGHAVDDQDPADLEDPMGRSGAFSSEGRVPQLDYALLAASKHSLPSLCLRTPKSCLLISMRRREGLLGQGVISPAVLEEESTNEMGGDCPVGSGLYRITPTLGCLCTGLPSDVIAQVSRLREEAEGYRRVLGHDISSRILALRLADMLQGQGQRPWTRPPACITVLASCHTQAENGPQLYRVDCTGQVCGMRAVVGGVEDVDGKGTELAEAVMQEDGGALLATLESQGDTASKGWKRLWELCRTKLGESLAGCGPDSFDVARAEVSGFRYIGRLDRLMGSTSTSTDKTG